MSAEIHQLPTAIASPETVMHVVMSDLDDIAAVTVIVQHKDKSYSVHWSNQSMAELAYGAKMLDIELVETIYHRRNGTT